MQLEVVRSAATVKPKETVLSQLMCALSMRLPWMVSQTPTSCSLGLAVALLLKSYIKERMPMSSEDVWDVLA